MQHLTSSAAIVAIIKNNPDIAIAAIIEPDSLPNLVTNNDLTTCQNSASGYEEGVAYALSSLDLPNVVQYVDAGHGGWLGWNDNLKPGAEELAKVYKAAGSPSNVRGISTNVAGTSSHQTLSISSHLIASLSLHRLERVVQEPGRV